MNYTGLHANIWKYFIVQFTNRRNFIPILSIYYLTLPNAHANEVGLYTGIGFFAAMLMQLPAWYIGDHWWQKNTIILSKVLIIFSSIFFLIADNFWIFTLGSIFMALWCNAFSSGTMSSLLKWTLEKLGRWEKYKSVASSISGNVSLLSIIFIITLPFFTQIDIKLPLIIGLIIDIIWLAIALSLFSIHTKIEKAEKKWILKIIREISKEKWFLSYALFAGIISGFLLADSAYRSLYLVEIWYPLIYIWFIMAWSRLVWWAVGKSIKTIEEYISFSSLIKIELLLFPIYYIGASHVSNPWILWIIFSLVIWWFWWRNEIYTDYLMDNTKNQKYRITRLSVKSQIENIIQIIVSFGIAWIMGISYQLGFHILWISLFIILSLVYFFWIRKTLN